MLDILQPRQGRNMSARRGVMSMKYLVARFATTIQLP